MSLAVHVDEAHAPSTDDQPDAAIVPWDVVDEWGLQSFPASDPPSNW